MRISILQTMCVVLVVSTFATGCARQISSDVYSGASVGEASTVYSGTVISARQIQVQDDEYLEGNGLGMLGGAVGGGILGSAFGKGSGQVLGAAVVAIGGAVAGTRLENNLKKQTATEYVVELDNGEKKSVVQQGTPLPIGQTVNLLLSERGRSRIVAAVDS